MENSLQLSIIIPIYNDFDDLQDLFNNFDVESIEQEVEYVFIDSSSIDSSENFFESIKKRIPDQNIVYKKIEPSYAGKSMNLGVDIARGKYIGFLDTKTIPVGDWPNNYIAELENKDIDVVLGNTKYFAYSRFQKILKAASYGEVLHETVPGSIIKAEKLKLLSPFQENLRASYDIVWKEDVKDSLNFSNPSYQSIIYKSLPLRLIDTLKKYFIYSLHTAKSDVQQNLKQTYLSILLILSALLVPRWNYLLPSWDQHPLYVADITKIYLFSVLLLLAVILIINRVFPRNKSSNIFLNSIKLIAFLLVSYSVYRWNAVFAQWIESAVLYIPHITKIYLVSLILLSIVYRGLVMPIQRKEAISFLFPLKWVQIGSLGLLIDIVKMPGYTLGALNGLLKDIFSRERN
tara:strand:+ start:28965 stop:30176 length:1212 start_codon:yes stop_codon:yes gene_type:complete